MSRLTVTTGLLERRLKEVQTELCILSDHNNDPGPKETLPDWIVEKLDLLYENMRIIAMEAAEVHRACARIDDLVVELKRIAEK